MAGRNIPSKSEVDSYLEDTNWGRWGDKSSAGAMNLITDEKRLEAVSLAKIGRTVSLSRPLPVTPAGETQDLPSIICTKRKDHMRVGPQWITTVFFITALLRLI